MIYKYTQYIKYERCIEWANICNAHLKTENHIDHRSYAGLVRGATQREIKLEITGNQNDELIKYLDDILLGLRYQDGHYNLVKLNDEEYQGKLKIQSD